MVNYPSQKIVTVCANCLTETCTRGVMPCAEAGKRTITDSEEQIAQLEPGVSEKELGGTLASVLTEAGKDGDIMKFVTARTYSASIYEVFSYGRRDHLYMVTSRIEGLKGCRSTVVKGLGRNAAIQRAADEADLSRIIHRRGCSRATARLHLQAERCNSNLHTAQCVARSAGILNSHEYCRCYCHSALTEAGKG